MTKIHVKDTASVIYFPYGDGNTINLSYTEGDPSINFEVALAEGLNYLEDLNVTIDILAAEPRLVNIKSDSYEVLKNITLPGEPTEYLRTISPLVKNSDSQYFIRGYSGGFQRNRWEALKAALGNFTVELGDDAFFDFQIIISLFGNHVESPANSIITVNVLGTSFPDVINHNQTNTVLEGQREFEFEIDGQGAPQVQDQLGSDSGRTYRVTLSAADPSMEDDFYFSIYHPSFNGGNTYTGNMPVLEGDQNTVNDILLGSSGSGGWFRFINNEDKLDQVVIEYKQEVIDGADGAPYIQELGELTFNVTPVPNFVFSSDFYNYEEDKTLTFTPAQINELYDNFGYTASLTLSDPSAGVFSEGTDIGGGVWEYTGSKSAVNALLTDLEFTPSPDYVGDFDITFGLSQYSNDKGSQVLDIYNVATDGDQITVNSGPYDWTTNSNTKLNNYATITDSRHLTDSDVRYEAQIYLSGAAHADGELRTFGSGGTSTWDGVGELVVNGTYTEVQSHLDSIEWWSRGTATTGFSVVLNLYRGIDGNFRQKILRIGANTTMNVGTVLPSPVNTNIPRLYDEDVKTSFSDDDKTGA